MKIWRALPGYDGRAALSTWIYAIVRNTAISMLRSRRNALSMSDPAVFDAAEWASATEDVHELDGAVVERLVAAPRPHQLDDLLIHGQWAASCPGFLRH